MNGRLQTTTWDRYSSFLVASVALAGLLTALLILLFFLQIEWRHSPVAMINVLPPFETPSLENASFEEDFEEIEVPPTPGETQLDDFREAVTDAISSTPALGPLLELDVEGDTGTDRRKTRPKGNEDGNGPSGISRKHWSIHFTLQSEREYLEQIDALGIELGLLDRVDPQVDYARNVSSEPVFRQDVRKSENRFFFYANTARVANWNRNVFRRQGIGAADKITLRFIPPSMLALMTQLELEACQKLDLDPENDLKSTLFGLERSGATWQVILIRVVPR